MCEAPRERRLAQKQRAAAPSSSLRHWPRLNLRSGGRGRALSARCTLRAEGHTHATHTPPEPVLNDLQLASPTVALSPPRLVFLSPFLLRAAACTFSSPSLSSPLSLLLSSQQKNSKRESEAQGDLGAVLRPLHSFSRFPLSFVRQATWRSTAPVPGAARASVSRL